MDIRHYINCLQIISLAAVPNIGMVARLFLMLFLFSLVICSGFPVIPFGLAVRIIAIPLSAGMTDEIFTTGHAGQNGALRLKIVHVFINRRCYIRYQTSEGVPSYIKYRLHIGSQLYFSCSLVFLEPHPYVWNSLHYIEHEIIIFLIEFCKVFLVRFTMTEFLKERLAVTYSPFII